MSKKYSEHCEFCDERTNWKIGNVFQRSGSREGRFRLKRNYDYCMKCGRNKKGVIEVIKKNEKS